MIFVGNTGHRPDGEVLHPDFSHPSRGRLRQTLRKIYRTMLDCSPIHLVNGGAQGFDMDSLQVAHELGLPKTLCCPYPGQAAGWPENVFLRYQELCRGAVDTVYAEQTDRNITPATFHKRNVMIVDRSDWIVGFLGLTTKGGTYGTLIKVEQKGIPVTLISPVHTESSYRVFHYPEGFTVSRYHCELSELLQVDAHG